MAPPTRTSREAWIQAGLSALAEGGPRAVRIEALAETLGVSKGGFYWHFTGRPALLEEMLDTWARASIDDVLDRVEESGGDAMVRARRAGAWTFSAGWTTSAHCSPRSSTMKPTSKLVV